jgi:hypothetical protein
VFDAEDAIIVSKINAPNMYDVIATHRGDTINQLEPRERGEILPKNQPRYGMGSVVDKVVSDEVWAVSVLSLVEAETSLD